MEFNLNGEIYSLMWTRRPDGTHFSDSSTPGWKSPLVRDGDNSLATHAELSDGTEAAKMVFGVGVAVGAVLTAGLTVAAIKAAPHVKSGLTSLESKLHRREEDIADAEAPVPLTVVAEVEPEQPDFPRLRAV